MNRTFLKLLICFFSVLVLSSCRKQTPDPVKPQPTPIPPAPTVDLLKTDPASLIKGIYTGSIYTRTPTRIGILSGEAQLLIKRLDTHRIGLYSVYGQMSSYQINLIVSRDTIKAIDGQTIDLDVVVRNNKPVDFHTGGTLKIQLTERQPDLVYFDWLNTTEFRPIFAYESVAGVQPSLGFLTGIYTSQFPRKTNGLSGLSFTHRPIVVRQVSSSEVELSDVNRWETPIRFTLRQSATDSTWSGENSTLRMAITVKGGQPQRFVLQPIVPDTTSTQWPPLNFEYDVRKPSYSSNFISL